MGLALDGFPAAGQPDELLPRGPRADITVQMHGLELVDSLGQEGHLVRKAVCTTPGSKPVGTDLLVA